MNITRPDNSSNSLALDVQALSGLRLAARQKSPQALKASARQFEALFLGSMIKSMREASAGGELSASADSKLYTAMLDQQISQAMAQRGVGLADYLLRQMTVTQPPLAAPTGASPVPSDAATSSTTGPPATAPAPAPAPALALALALALAPAPATAPAPAPSTAATSGLAPTCKPVAVVSVQSLARDFRVAMGPAAQAAARQTGLPASFILGQAALESGWGRRQIMAPDGTPSFNVFGLKAGAHWKGKVTEVATTEYKDGVAKKVVARFRAYDSYEQAFSDYAQLLRHSPRYRQVLANGQTVAGFAQGMQQAGYATDPAYAAKLARVIGRTLTA